MLREAVRDGKVKQEEGSGVAPGPMSKREKRQSSLNWDKVREAVHNGKLNDLYASMRSAPVAGNTVETTHRKRGKRGKHKHRRKHGTKGHHRRRSSGTDGKGRRRRKRRRTTAAMAAIPEDADGPAAHTATRRYRERPPPSA